MFIKAKTKWRHRVVPPRYKVLGFKLDMPQEIPPDCGIIYFIQKE